MVGRYSSEHAEANGEPGERQFGARGRGAGTSELRGSGRGETPEFEGRSKWGRETRWDRAVGARASAAVGRRGACARGGTAVGARNAGPVSGRCCQWRPAGRLYFGKEPACSRKPRGVPELFGEGFRRQRRGLGPRWEKPEFVDVTGFPEPEGLPSPTWSCSCSAFRRDSWFQRFGTKTMSN